MNAMHSDLAPYDLLAKRSSFRFGHKLGIFASFVIISSAGTSNVLRYLRQPLELEMSAPVIHFQFAFLHLDFDASAFGPHSRCCHLYGFRLT
jgi:hypothetical protein